MHAQLPPQAAALLTGAALDMESGSAREAMEALAGLLTREREWLMVYASGGTVLLSMDQAAAKPEVLERYEELWRACEGEATAALGAFLPGKGRFK